MIHLLRQELPSRKIAVCGTSMTNRAMSSHNAIVPRWKFEAKWVFERGTWRSEYAHERCPRCVAKAVVPSGGRYKEGKHGKWDGAFPAGAVVHSYLLADEQDPHRAPRDEEALVCGTQIKLLMPVPYTYAASVDSSLRFPASPFIEDATCDACLVTLDSFFADGLATVHDGGYLVDLATATISFCSECGCVLLGGITCTRDICLENRTQGTRRRVV